MTVFSIYVRLCVCENICDSAPWIGVCAAAARRVCGIMGQGRRKPSGTQSTEKHRASNGWHGSESADLSEKVAATLLTNSVQRQGRSRDFSTSLSVLLLLLLFGCVAPPVCLNLRRRLLSNERKSQTESGRVDATLRMSVSLNR